MHSSRMHTAHLLPYSRTGVSLIEIPRRETPRQRPLLEQREPWQSPPLDRDAPGQRPPGHARFGQHYHKGFLPVSPLEIMTQLYPSLQNFVWHCTFTVLPIQLLRWFNWLATLSMSLVMGKTSNMCNVHWMFRSFFHLGSCLMNLCPYF